MTTPTPTIPMLEVLMANREQALSRARAHALRAVNDPFAANCFEIADDALVRALRNAAPHLLAVAKAAAKFTTHSVGCGMTRGSRGDEGCVCGLREIKSALAALQSVGVAGGGQ